MVADYLIDCVNKPDRNSRHEHITHVGNMSGGWKLTREDAVRRIDAGTDNFHTKDPTTGKRAYIGVVRQTGKAPYLQTHADGNWNDNLLAQAECTGSCKVIG